MSHVLGHKDCFRNENRIQWGSILELLLELLALLGAEMTNQGGLQPRVLAGLVPLLSSHCSLSVFTVREAYLDR